MAITVIDHNPTHQGLLDMRANIPFASPDGEELCLQLVKPQWSSGGQGFPLVLFIQGSGWTKPNQFWEIPQLCLLAMRGYVIASVTHRSCFTAPAPAFLQDVKNALRFLKANAQEFDIDKNRVCAWGTSSGGNTSLLLGLTADDPAFETSDYAGESTAVQAVAACFGPACMVDMYDHQSAELKHSEENLLFHLTGKDPLTCREKLALVDPAAYVKPGRQLPPFLLLHGDADNMVAYEQSESFYHLLTENGCQADLVRVTNAPHEDTFWSRELLEIIFAFIEKNLK